MHDPDDAALARAAAGDDAAAFGALVRRHERAVRHFLERLTRGDGSADDLAQETFVKAWRTARSWRGDGSYAGWLMRIAWTTFLSDRRSGARRAAREQAVYEQAETHSRDPGIAIDVDRALTSLMPPERAAALLCLGEGYSHGEAATILALPLGTLKSMVGRARTRLAAALEEQDDTG